MKLVFQVCPSTLDRKKKNKVCPSTNKMQICNIWRTQTPSLKHISTPTLSTQMSTRQRSIFSWTGIDAVWSSWEVDGSDANWPSEFVFITKSLARMAAEDALTDVLEGSRSSPPLKHMTINFWRKKNDTRVDSYVYRFLTINNK